MLIQTAHYHPVRTESACQEIFMFTKVHMIQ